MNIQDIIIVERILFEDQRDDRFTFSYIGRYKCEKFRVIVSYYDYIPDVKLICIDRESCFNKESQSPIQFLSNEIQEEYILDALDYLATDDGERDSSCFRFGEIFPLVYEGDARLRFYNQIWNVPKFIKQRESELGINYRKDFQNVNWIWLAKTDSVKALERIRDEKP